MCDEMKMLGTNNVKENLLERMWASEERLFSVELERCNWFIFQDVEAVSTVVISNLSCYVIYGLFALHAC
jgi:hypothetical protein